MDVKLLGAASRYAMREYGGIFQTKDYLVNIDATPRSVIPANPDRISLLAINNSTTNITLSRNTPPQSGLGILLLGNGADFSATARDDANLPELEFWGISDLAGGVLYVLEVIQAFDSRQVKE